MGERRAITRVPARAPGRSWWRRELRGIYVIAKKDAMLYYFRSPVLIHGVLFPAFFFLAFCVGRDVAAETAVPGILAMALFFTASAVGPLVTPWERRSKTYERLVSSPISPFSIILGDVAAGACFGLVLSAVPLGLGLGLADVRPARLGMLVGALVFSAFCFGSLGVLLSAPPTRNPAQIMMLSNLVRMPLIFISGVFVPLAEMPAWSRRLAPLSPLSYCADLVRAAFGARHYFPVWLDFSALAGASLAFLLAARFFHHRARAKAL